MEQDPFTDLWNLGQPVLSTHLSALLVTLDEIRQHNEWLVNRETKYCPLILDEDGNETRGPETSSEDDGTADGHYFAYELESVQMCLGTIPMSRDLPNVVLTMLGMPGFTTSELQVSLEQDLHMGFYRPGEVHPRDLAAHYHCEMLFNTIFCGQSITMRAKNQAQTVRRSTIESVVIPMFGMDDHTFSGLCSSLAEASLVQKLTINGAFRPLTPTQRTWRWQWLTYALFSNASRSSIEEINLMGVQLSNADIDAITEVLLTSLPEPDQTGAYTDGRMCVEYVYVPKGTSVGIRKSIASPNDSTTLNTIDDFVFRFLQDDGENNLVNVLVPGRGNGVIASDHVRRVLDDDPEIPFQPNRSPNGITSLSLSIDSNAEQDMSVLIEFLQLVGKSLLKLSIQTVGSGAMDIHAILRACPNLDQLFLDNVSINLDTFMLEVESGDADIRCFGLLYCNVPAEAMTRFAKKLADPESALACGMRELCLSADNEVSPMTDENVQAFLNVLKTNDKLVYLDLLVLPPLFDKYAAAFRKHHQETLTIEKEKLPLRCRLSFLSVIRGHLTPVNDVFHHLDNHLLRHIFSFAAVSAKRTICLRCDH
ncbi:Hypothetical protein PHPALM_37063 [Phytophthora palmivora]|uniref:Uncharacterized protein n=1 Tax=Phytophthora palmivora TaxID=4796 RepID=A0A2P4WYC3_9STRA|nr:Hypothetical protein PHPALM_37063 [Phytophthora palmivora]